MMKIVQLKASISSKQFPKTKEVNNFDSNNDRRKRNKVKSTTGKKHMCIIQITKFILQCFDKYNPVKYYLDGNASQVILTHMIKLYFGLTKRKFDVTLFKNLIVTFMSVLTQYIILISILNNDNFHSPSAIKEKLIKHNLFAALNYSITFPFLKLNLENNKG